MTKYLNKYKYLYLFIITITIIGFITGFFYYKTQPATTKESIKESINIKEDLSTNTNNLLKRIKDIGIIFISSIFIIPLIFNYLKTFIKPFEIGFIFSYLLSYNIKLSIIYTLIYHIIPLIFILILIRVSTTISYNIIKYIYNKNLKSKKTLLLIIKKYILISLFLLIYEFIILIFSPNINGYLMTFLLN